MIRADPSTIYVNHFGTARVGSICDADLRARGEAERLQMIKERSMPPAACGDDIVSAPGRGPMVQTRPLRVEMTPAGPRARHDGYMLRAGARVADAFDLMTLNSRKAHARLCAAARRRGIGEPAFKPPFTVGQVEIAREYAALAERCAASGIKCASLEALRQVSSGGSDREEAMLADFRRLRYFELRIGNGLAKSVRRLRPSGSVSKAKKHLVDRQRKAIVDQVLVDAVCLGGLTLSGVLERHGWSSDTKSLEALRSALCAALERMRGYDLVQPQERG